MKTNVCQKPSMSSVSGEKADILLINRHIVNKITPIMAQTKAFER